MPAEAGFAARTKESLGYRPLPVWRDRRRSRVAVQGGWRNAAHAKSFRHLFAGNALRSLWQGGAGQHFIAERRCSGTTFYRRYTDQRGRGRGSDAGRTSASLGPYWQASDASENLKDCGCWQRPAAAPEGESAGPLRVAHLGPAMSVGADDVEQVRGVAAGQRE
jgi:hypothetical protein